jgi:uncharacterized delta-60 repeat protein
VVASTDGGDLIVARLNPDGTPDASFGEGGIVRTALGVSVVGVEVATMSDGKVVFGAELGSAYGPPTVVVTRFTRRGAFDPTFNRGSPVFTSLGSSLGGLGLTAGGAIYLAGAHCCGSSVYVVRLRRNGVFDARFGRRGHRFVDDVVKGARVGAVVPLPGGNVDVVGAGRRQRFFALRLLPSSRLDSSFGHRGVAYVNDAAVSVAGAAVDGRGRLVLGGASESPTLENVRDIALVRLLGNGHLDRHFGGGQPVRQSFGSYVKVAAIGLQSMGQIVAGVTSSRCERGCDEIKPLLVRFLGGSGVVRCAGHKATIVGTRRGEALTGTRHRDVIAALAGNDVVNGRGGNDLICGNRGNDRLRGGPGRDRLFGGPGHDRREQ